MFVHSNRYIVRYHANDDDSVIPERFGAYIRKGIVIHIRERYRNDEGLHRHEYRHALRAIRSLGIYWLRYRWSKKFRYKAELECYRIQLRYTPASTVKKKKYYIDMYAGFMATKYDLDIRKGQAYWDLIK